MLVMLSVFGPDSALEILVAAINIEKQPHNNTIMFSCSYKINMPNEFVSP